MIGSVADSGKPRTWSIVVFLVDGNENHCGLDIPGVGLADCSLAGARIIDWQHRSLPKGDRLFFEIDVPKPEGAVAFASLPCTLTYPIIAQEKRQRGWHLTRDAPNFVRTLRRTRSRNPKDLNCVEWLWFVLEQGGRSVPDDVLTPTELAAWCHEQGLSCRMEKLTTVDKTASDLLGNGA